MNRFASILLVCSIAITACSRAYEKNPDPNHTHADFAVWINGRQVQFSDADYMSGVSWDEASQDEADEYHHEHLHLHDEVGHVLHRHKPGLSLKEFFDSLDFAFDERDWRMFVFNPRTDSDTWREIDFNLSYVFMDMDSILITDSFDEEAVQHQQLQMTYDACLYSKTCPWRGDPPAENCVADPTIPCVVPEEDL